MEVCESRKEEKGRNLEMTIWGVTNIKRSRNGGGREKSGRRGSVGIGLGEKKKFKNQIQVEKSDGKKEKRKKGKRKVPN